MLFMRVVLVKSREHSGEELALVTSEVTSEDGKPKLVVFLPGAPNPAAGRLLVADIESTRPIDMSVSDALKALVSVGKTQIPSFTEITPQTQTS